MNIPAYFLPGYVPGVTRPEDWIVVKFPNGRIGYVETKFLKKVGTT